MIFNKHSRLEGRHAFLSPSQYHWIRYDEDKLADRVLNAMTASRGVELHQLAHDLIRLGVKLPSSKKTLNLYVNDAIGYHMTPEQPLYFSPNCYGTTDAISFRRNFLRIHDLKTGVSPTYMQQLLVYTALFCLEYNKDPGSIEIELRIYQSDEIWAEHPNPEDIQFIIDRIITFDKQIEELNSRY